MPNVDKPETINGVKCGPTHHLACDCREAYIKQLEKVREAAEAYVKEAQCHLKHVEGKTGMWHGVELAYESKFKDLLFPLKQALAEVNKGEI